MATMILFDLHALAHFQEDRPYVQVLSDIGTVRLILFGFRAGQQLRDHHTSSQILVQVLQGQVTFSSEGSSVNLQAGTLIQLEAKIPHSVIAETDAVMLLTMTPSPTLEHSASGGQRPLVQHIADETHEDE